jgi:hypothetical protein
VPLLEAADHRALAVTCRGVGARAGELTAEIGLESYIADVISDIEAADLTGVVLMGIPMAAGRSPGRRPNPRARLPRHQSGAGGTIQFSMLPPELVAARRAAAAQSPGELSMPSPPASAFGITNHADIGWVESQLTPQPLKTYVDALRLEHRSAMAGRRPISPALIRRSRPLQVPMNGRWLSRTGAMSRSPLAMTPW